MNRNEVREKIIDAIKDKRPDDSDESEKIADFILSQPYVNEDTYETFLENAGLLDGE